MNNKNTLKDLSTILTAGIFFSYIIGYLVVTGYMSNYDIINDDLLNLNFLKAGLVFLIVLVPPLLIIHHGIYKHEEFQKLNYKHFLLLLAHLIVMLIVFVFLSMITDALTPNFNLLLGIIGIIISICIAYYLVYKFLSWVGFKEFNFGHFTAHLIWICLLSYFFGSHLYRDLPNSFKGGFPNSTSILCKVESREYLNSIGFNFNDSTFSDSVDILYSSNDKLLISKKAKYYFLSKDLFNGFKTLNRKK